jgi:hypothetical protein
LIRTHRVHGALHCAPFLRRATFVALRFHGLNALVRSRRRLSRCFSNRQGIVRASRTPSATLRTQRHAIEEKTRLNETT